MIRRLEKRDIIHCVEIVTENWGTAAALDFHDEVKHAFRPGMKWPPEYFVFEHATNGKTVGFAGMMHSWVMHGVWDLIWINVAKNYQGLGIGKQLTEHRIHEIDRQKGAVINLMTKEVQFFHKFGFEELKEYDGGWSFMTMQLRKLKI